MDISVSKYIIELNPTEMINLRFILNSIIDETKPSGN